jgi:hypothetical protein
MNVCGGLPALPLHAFMVSFLCTGIISLNSVTAMLHTMTTNKLDMASWPVKIANYSPK